MKSLKSIFAGFSIVIVLTSNVGSALAVDAGQSCKSAGSATTSKYKGKKVQLKCSKVGNKLRWVQVKTTTTTTVSPQSTTNLNPLGGNDPEDFLMPNVVCMNLQEAQDEIQDHGVLYSKSKDASGRNRMQLNDSNWGL